MEKIINLLKTPEGAQALKSKLKGMPENEKVKANYQKIWKIVCAKVNEYTLKQIKKKQPMRVRLKDQEGKKRSEVKHHEALSTQQSSSQKRESSLIRDKNRRTQKSKQPQFSEKEVTAMIVRLEHTYPKLFNSGAPKPLKVGIFDDILETNDWDMVLLKSAIKTYTRSDLYYLSFINERNRYDLSGEQVSSITIEDEDHATDRLRKTVGRFNVLAKYPQLIGRENKSKPNPVRSEFYGNHYYAEKRFFEIKEILSEYYGRDVKMKKKEAKITDNKKYRRLTTVIQNKKVIFSTEAYGTTRKIASKLSEIKLLVHLQNNIEAYPFPYKKLDLSAAKIEQQFFDYYKEKK